jgi:cell shape-determining protein MreC
MTYLTTNRHSGLRKYGTGKIVLLIVFALITLAIVLFPSFFDALFTSVARPFWRTEFALNSGTLGSDGSLVAENENLKIELETLRNQYATVTATEMENAELHTLLGRASSTPGILAAVTMRPPMSAYDEIVIDIGSDRGIHNGDKVYAPGQVPIGTVKEVNGSTSKVLLFTSPGQEFDVLIGKSRSPAKVSSRGGGQFEAELPRGATVAEGDWVTFGTLGDKPLGVVSAVLVDDVDALMTAIIVPPVSVYNIRWVYVKPSRQ